MYHLLFNPIDGKKEKKDTLLLRFFLFYRGGFSIADEYVLFVAVEVTAVVLFFKVPLHGVALSLPYLGRPVGYRLYPYF